METSENKFLIPLAVVVAGALVAGAVFFKSAGTPTSPDGTPTVTDITISEVTAADHIFGNPNAPIKIVEYSDIECPYCKDFHATMEKIMDTYGKDGQVAWIFRDFPLDSLHPDARAKAESAECVASLAGNDVYWKYLGALFARQETLADLPAIATEFGVDQTAFNACVSEKRFADKVQASTQDAMKAGARGTPYSILITKDGTKVPLNGAQPYNNVKEVIDSALKAQ